MSTDASQPEPITWKWAWEAREVDYPDLWLGTVILRLLTQTREWVHRRTETAGFLGDDAVQRRVGVDIELPISPIIPFVPLTLLRKGPLTGFDLRDEAGSALPMLTSRENGLVAWSILVAAGEAVIGKPLPTSVVEDLRAVAVSAVKEAVEVLDRMRNGDLAGVGRTLMDDPGFEVLAYDLAENFILLVPLEDGPGQRRVLKFSYVEPLEWPHIRLPETMGWRAFEFGFVVPAVGDCGSYHFEIEAPEGLEIAGARLFAYGGPPDAVEDSFGRSDATRAHLYLSGVSRTALGGAQVWLRTPGRGFVRHAFLSGLATAVLMLLMAWLSPWIEALNAEAASGLLLVIPGFISIFVARPGEHPMASRLLSGMRWVLLVLAVVAYAGAFLLVVASRWNAREPALWVLVAMAVLCVLSLAVSLFKAKEPMNAA